MPKLSIKPFHPSTVAIDGQEIRIRVARFDLEADKTFRQSYERVNEAVYQRPLQVRQPGEETEMRPRGRVRTPAEARGAEQLEVLRQVIAELEDPACPLAETETEAPAALRGVAAALEALVPAEPTEEVFVIPDEEIVRRRLAELAPEARADYERVKAEEEAFAEEFFRRSITDHVEVEAGEIEIEDDSGVRSLTSGGELFRYWCTRIDVMRQLMLAIWSENALSAELKNALRSRSGSGASSAGRDRAAAGATPAPPAASARPEVSAGSAAAMASTAAASSGSIGISS